MPHVSKPTCTEDTVNEAGNLEPENNQILLACILLLPKDSAPILALLRQANKIQTLAPPTSRNSLTFTRYL